MTTFIDDRGKAIASVQTMGFAGGALIDASGRLFPYHDAKPVVPMLMINKEHCLFLVIARLRLSAKLPASQVVVGFVV